MNRLSPRLRITVGLVGLLAVGGLTMLVQGFAPIYAAAEGYSQGDIALLMFLMLPVFSFLLTLMYWRRGRYYVEHLVFATHLHTFAYLVYIVLLLVPDEPEGDVMTVVTNWTNNFMPWLLAGYHVLALRRFYAGGWIGTIFAFGFQMAVYFVVLLPLSLALVTLFTLATL